MRLVLGPPHRWQGAGCAAGGAAAGAWVDILGVLSWVRRRSRVSPMLGHPEQETGRTYPKVWGAEGRA